MTPRAGPLAGFIANNLGPRTLFLAGALLFPAFLFQNDLGLRSLEILLFFLLNALSGRRVRWVQTLVVGSGIVAFNLVIPTGRVLVSIMGVPLTEEALRSGLAKATAVIGMIALSQLSISPDLSFPGRLGGLIGRTLFYFERIIAERKRLRRGRILEQIDGLLLEIHAMCRTDAVGEGNERRSTGRRTTLAGYAFLGMLVAVTWGLLVLAIVSPGIIWAR